MDHPEPPEPDDQARCDAENDAYQRHCDQLEQQEQGAA